jgi:hypothetical protein
MSSWNTFKKQTADQRDVNLQFVENAQWNQESTPDRVRSFCCL